MKYCSRIRRYSQIQQCKAFNHMAFMVCSKDLWESVFLFYHVNSRIEFRSFPA